jgi:hypothetical protein
MNVSYPLPIQFPYHESITRIPNIRIDVVADEIEK